MSSQVRPASRMGPAAKATPLKKATSLRERNKQRVRRQIVEAAVKLAARDGLATVTAEDIAHQAEVSRATFFRYFDSKEAAVVVGFYEERLSAMVSTLAHAPRELSPIDAVMWTFSQMDGGDVEEHDRLVRLGARLKESSASFRAKAADYRSRYEQAIASAVSGHMQLSGPDDLRPHLIAASVLAVIDACIERWSTNENGPDLPELMRTGLEQLKTGFADGDASSDGTKHAV